MMIDVAGETETTYYYHFDGLGSVAAVSDNTGGIAERYSYNVFGEPNRISDVNNPYLFTARRYDTETANYYYRARYYNTEIGRFMSPDPLGLMPDGGPRNPFSPLNSYSFGINLYSYCYNDPINMDDPSGLGPKWWHCLKCTWMMRNVANECGRLQCAHVCDHVCTNPCTYEEILDCADCMRIQRPKCIKDCIQGIADGLADCVKCGWKLS